MILSHFKKFTDRLEGFTNNVLTKYLSKIFLRPFVLKIIKWYNLLLLVVFNLGFAGYYFDYPLMQYMYKVLVIFFGVNAFNFIIQGFVTFKFKFCSWSKLAFVCDIICYALVSLEFLTHNDEDPYFSPFLVYLSLFMLLAVVIYGGVTYRISDTIPSIKDSDDSPT